MTFAQDQAQIAVYRTLLRSLFIAIETGNRDEVGLVLEQAKQAYEDGALRLEDFAQLKQELSMSDYSDYDEAYFNALDDAMDEYLENQAENAAAEGYPLETE